MGILAAPQQPLCPNNLVTLAAAIFSLSGWLGKAANLGRKLGMGCINFNSICIVSPYSMWAGMYAGDGGGVPPLSYPEIKPSQNYLVIFCNISISLLEIPYVDCFCQCRLGPISGVCDLRTVLQLNVSIPSV